MCVSVRVCAYVKVPFFLNPCPIFWRGGSGGVVGGGGGRVVVGFVNPLTHVSRSDEQQRS